MRRAPRAATTTAFGSSFAEEACSGSRVDALPLSAELATDLVELVAHDAGIGEALLAIAIEAPGNELLERLGRGGRQLAEALHAARAYELEHRVGVGGFERGLADEQLVAE